MARENIMYVAAVVLAVYSACFAQPPRKDRTIPRTTWISFPDSRFDVRGLPWFAENSPATWRLPKRARQKVRQPVWSLGRFPAGARIRFTSNTSQLRIRIHATRVQGLSKMSAIGGQGLDVYVNGAYWSSVAVAKRGQEEKVFFTDAGDKKKHITIYLPTFQELRIEAIGVDQGAELTAPKAFALKRPVVFYGSSILQGACSSRPGMSYPAILARMLNVDYVNLGFSGNGRGEKEVTALLSEIDASCFVFDLGKSYRRQGSAAYSAMLAAIRSRHPKIPMICITPIISTRELHQKGYAELSRHVRQAMRRGARKHIDAGDTLIHLIRGTDLLGAKDTDAFQEGVHPTDLGFHRIAVRLGPTLEKALGRPATRK